MRLSRSCHALPIRPPFTTFAVIDSGALLGVRVLVDTTPIRDTRGAVGRVVVALRDLARFEALERSRAEIPRLQVTGNTECSTDAEVTHRVRADSHFPQSSIPRPLSAPAVVRPSSSTNLRLRLLTCQPTCNVLDHLAELTPLRPTNGAFPHRQASPTRSVKLPAYARVPLSVPNQLLLPKRRPTRGSAKQETIMHVPETTVDEDDRVEPAKHDVRPSWETLHVNPIPKATRMQRLPHSQFECGIRPADRCHDPAAGRPIYPVYHCLLPAGVSLLNTATSYRRLMRVPANLRPAPDFPTPSITQIGS